MGYLRDLIVGAAGSLIAAEFYVHADPFARWIIRRAVARLPASDRDRRMEEWLADLNDISGAVGKLFWAIGCQWAVTVANARAAHPTTLRHTVDRWNIRANQLTPRQKARILFWSGALLGGFFDSIYELTGQSPYILFALVIIAGCLSFFMHLIFRPRKAASDLSRR